MLKEKCNMSVQPPLKTKPPEECACKTVNKKIMFVDGTYKCWSCYLAALIERLK